MTPEDEAWAKRVMALIRRLRKRGVPEEELAECEDKLLEIVGDKK